MYVLVSSVGLRPAVNPILKSLSHDETTPAFPDRVQPHARRINLTSFNLALLSFFLFFFFTSLRLVSDDFVSPHLARFALFRLASPLSTSPPKKKKKASELHVYSFRRGVGRWPLNNK